MCGQRKLPILDLFKNEVMNNCTHIHVLRGHSTKKHFDFLGKDIQVYLGLLDYSLNFNFNVFFLKFPRGKKAKNRSKNFYTVLYTLT